MHLYLVFQLDVVILLAFLSLSPNMLRVLQCTAKQMAHFILETDPFLSMGIVVSKEVLKWNHLSKSCMEIIKLIYHIYGQFAYKKKEEKLGKGNASCCISKIHCAAVLLRMCIPRFPTNKFVRSGEHKAPGNVVIDLPSVWDPSSISPAVYMKSSSFKFCCKNGSVPHPDSFPGQASSSGHCSDGRWQHCMVLV